MDQSGGRWDSGQRENKGASGPEDEREMGFVSPQGPGPLGISKGFQRAGVSKGPGSRGSSSDTSQCLSTTYIASGCVQYA